MPDPDNNLTPQKRGKIDLTATLACLGAITFWAMGPNFIKYLTAHLDAWTQNMLRYLAACVFWLPYLALTYSRGKFSSSVWKKALLPASANIVMQSLWAAAFYYLDPAFMNLLARSSIIMIAAFSLVFFPDERPLIRSPRFWLGAALSVIGIVGVMLAEPDFGSRTTVTGIIITLACAFMWALYTIAIKVSFRQTDSRIGFSIMSIYTVAGLCILALLFGRPADCLEMPPFPWFCVIFSGVTSIALSHVLYYTAIRRIGATIPALTMLATPAFVFAISSVAFHERLTALQIIFGLILLAGSALAIYSQQHLSTPKEGITQSVNPPHLSSNQN
jgi:drug/metabolite transporter (DMT)-like permease